MNNFYAILRITQISDIIFDYYNKCKLSYEIVCIDTDCKYNSKIIVHCDEKLIDNIYAKLKKDDVIFVYGKVINKESITVIAERIEMIK